MSGTREFDIVIAGGGMVGATLALALAPTGWRIGLVDPVAVGGPSSPSFDDRATALSWSSRRLFQALGLWDGLVSDAAAITHIHVSEQGRLGRARLHARDLDQSALGHVVPNRSIGRVLAAAMQDESGIEWIQAGVESGPVLDASAGRIRIGTDEGAMDARLLVVADGARSRLRDGLDISTRTTAFDHQALVANVAVSRPHDGWAYERFTPAGPLAMLPLPDSDVGEPRMNLIMSVKQGEAAVLREMDDKRLCELIQARFGAHLGCVRRIGHRAVYPLSQVRARQLTATRAVLAGNAAMALHPVAGQGFNLALRGVADLADRLSSEAMADGDPGNPAMLQAHERERNPDLRATGAWTTGLVNGFTSPFPGLGWLRGKALLTLDRTPLLRRAFIARAMGIMPGLAPLSRGIGVGRHTGSGSS